MRQRRATMSEEERQVLREIVKHRMRLKRASLNTEQKQEFCKRDKEDVPNGPLSNPKNKRHNIKDVGKGYHERWTSFTPEEKETYRKRH